nr:hypothetical protein [Tanacetum cinerariifolium]
MISNRFVYKMVTFMVDLYHDGLFASNPLRYLVGEHRVIKDINFKGLRPICNDEQLNDFVQALFDNDCHLDMYIEHQGYDVLEMINDDRHCEDKSDCDFKDVEKGDNLDDVKDIVEFQTKGEENVDIPKLSIDDPWLNKLVGKGRFVGEIEDPIHGLKGMKFESLSQLKPCLANYGVTYGYQLWYIQNDTYKLLVKCGRDVSAGKCAGKRGKKQVQIDYSLDKDKGKVGEGSSHKDLGKGSAGGSSNKSKGKLGLQVPTAAFPIPTRHSGAFLGDMSLGIPFPGDKSSGKRHWGRLVRDSFPGDNPRRK